MNEIRISFDHQRAIRISDGQKLAAVPVGSSFNRCNGCAVPARSGSCMVNEADNPRIRCCNAAGRKDKRDIVWRPV